MVVPSGPKQFIVSWDDLHRNAKALAWRLVEIGGWCGIVAITRGGLVPAAIVARELDIRLIETVCVSAYRSNDETGVDSISDTKILKPPGNIGDGSGWLIIDDLVDTGQTISVLRPLIPKAHFATIYAKPKGRPLVNTFVTEVSQDTWIYFPWDIELQFTQPIVTKKEG